MDTMHHYMYEIVPEFIRKEFDPYIAKRVTRNSTYAKSNQVRYALVTEQTSGGRGYKQDEFAVTNCQPLNKGGWRLGRVNDSKFGAFLTCAHFVDPSTIYDPPSTTAFLNSIMSDLTHARDWMDKVRDNLCKIPVAHGGGRKRKSPSPTVPIETGSQSTACDDWDTTLSEAEEISDVQCDHVEVSSQSEPTFEYIEDADVEEVVEVDKSSEAEAIEQLDSFVDSESLMQRTQEAMDNVSQRIGFIDQTIRNLQHVLTHEASELARTKAAYQSQVAKWGEIQDKLEETIRKKQKINEQHDKLKASLQNQKRFANEQSSILNSVLNDM